MSSKILTHCLSLNLAYKLLLENNLVQGWKNFCEERTHFRLLPIFFALSTDVCPWLLNEYYMGSFPIAKKKKKNLSAMLCNMGFCNL